MTLYRGAAQEEIDLVVIVPVPPKILDDSQACLAVRNGCVKVVLLTILVDREALPLACQIMMKGGNAWAYMGRTSK